MAKFKLTQTVRNEEIQAEHRDFPYWRTSDTSEICNETLLSDCKLIDDSFKVDKSFKNEAAQRAYLVFTKFDVSISIKSSILSISRLDAPIACSIGFLQGQCKGTTAESLSQSAPRAVEDFELSTFPASAENQECGQRCGCKPLDTIGYFKGYMSAAISQLINFCCN